MSENELKQSILNSFDEKFVDKDGNFTEFIDLDNPSVIPVQPEQVKSFLSEALTSYAKGIVPAKKERKSPPAFEGSIYDLADNRIIGWNACIDEMNLSIKE